MSEVASAAPAPSSVPSSAPVDAVEPAEADLAEVDAADEAESKKTEIKSSKKKYSPKVNGRQRDIEFDPSNDEEVLKYLSKAMAADEKFEEAANLRKNVELLVSQLKSDPRGVLSHPELGIDLKKFAQDILNEEIEEMQKTPEQKELEQLRKELSDKDKKLKVEEEGKRAAEMARLEEQAFKQFDDDITQALEKSSLPKSPYVVKRLADTMIEAVNLGFKDVTVFDILPIVEQQVSGELQKMFEMMPEDVMEQLIGKNNLGRLRKKRLSTMKKPVETSGQVKETAKESKKEAKDSPKRDLKMRDFFSNF